MTENNELTKNTPNYFDDYDFLNFSYKQITNIKEGLKLGGKNGISFEANPERYNQLLEEIKNNKSLKTQKILKGNPSNIMINEHTIHHFNFTICIDYMEYLTGLDETKSSIENALKLSKNFVYISQDNFDSDIILFKRGFKTNYSDWSAYTNHLTSNIYFNILFDYYKLGHLEDFIIFYSDPINNSNNQYIHPLNSSANQGKYNHELHPYKKENIAFNNIFHKLNILIAVKGFKNLDTIYEKIESEKNILYDSRKGMFEKKIEGIIEEKKERKKGLFGKVNNMFSSDD